MRHRSEPLSGGSWYGLEGSSLFHVISAFEGWIANNMHDDGKIIRSAPVAMDGRICMMVLQKDFAAMIVATKIEDLSIGMQAELGLDEIGHAFQDTDWVLSCDHYEELDPTIYEPSTGRTYSLNATLEEADELPTTTEDEEEQERQALREGYAE